MISILIPVYNRDVMKLVHVLGGQLLHLAIPGEIIIIDDRSQVSFIELNKELAGIPFVQYFTLEKNIGRIAIRQRLAEKAKFDWLLFLDCDSTIVSDQFLKTYCNQLTNPATVTVGGRIYTQAKSTDCRFMLHWKYGTNREVTTFGNNRRVNRFMTNNFIISKSVFTGLDFSNGWAGYGYEDTWMAIQLEAMKVTVIFIDNPVLHEGVEDAVVFIEKNEEALQNLKKLSRLVTPDILSTYVRLYKYFKKLQSLRMLWTLQVTYFFLRKFTDKNLKSCNPSLLLFDLYRLNYFRSKY